MTIASTVVASRRTMPLAVRGYFFLRLWATSFCNRANCAITELITGSAGVSSSSA
jgi:hypothetical protein